MPQANITLADAEALLRATAPAPAAQVTLADAEALLNATATARAPVPDLNPDAVAAVRKAGAQLRAAQIPVPSVAGDFDPPFAHRPGLLQTPTGTAPVSGLRNYLHAYTGGELDLDLNLVPSDVRHTRINAARAAHLLNNPLLAEMTLEDPGLNDKLNGLYDTADALNTIPASPRELNAVFPQLLQTWLTNTNRQNLRVDPATAANLTAKLVHEAGEIDFSPRPLIHLFPAPEPATHLHVPQSALNLLSASEKATYNALGATDFLAFARTAGQGFVARERLAKLTGNPAAPPLDLDDARRAAPVTIEHLTPISSVAADVASRQAALAESQQAALVADLRQRAGSPIRHVISGVAENPVGAARDALAATAYGIDTLAAGALTAAYEGVRAVIPNKDGWGQLISGAARGVMRLTGETASQDAALEQMLDSLPDLPAEARAETLRLHFNAATAASQWARKNVTEFEKFFTGRDKTAVGTWFGTALGETAGLVAGLGDDPANVAFTALGLRDLHRWAGGQPLIRARAAMNHVFRGIDDLAVASGETRISALQRAPLLQRIENKLRRVTDPNEARAIGTRLRAVLDENPGGLDPATTAGVETALDRLNTALASSAGSKLTPEARAALRDAGSFLPELPLTDAGWTLTGEGNPINIASSAELARRSNSYLKRVDEAFKAADTESLAALAGKPPARPTLAVRSLRGALKGLLSTTEKIRATHARRLRLGELLDDTEALLRRELAGASEVITRIDDTHQTLLREQRTFLSERLDRVDRFASSGEVVLQTISDRARRPLWKKLTNAFADLDSRKSVADLYSERAAREIGGADWAAELAKLPPAEAAEAFYARAELWHRQGFEPKQISRRDVPRVDTAALRKKLADTPADELVSLSPTELQALSAYGTSPLRLLSSSQLKPLTDTARRLRARLSDISETLADVGAYRGVLGSADPGRVPLPSKRLQARLKDSLSGTGARIVNKSYISLADDLKRSELAAHQALAEALEFGAREEALLTSANPWLEVSSAELAKLPPAFAKDYLHRVANNLEGERIIAFLDQARAGKTLRRKLNAEQLAELHVKLDTGVIDADTAAILTATRRRLLDERLAEGFMTADEHARLTAANYVHHSYEGHTAAARHDAGLRHYAIEGASFEPVRADFSVFQGRLPAEGYGVRYLDPATGNIAIHKPGGLDTGFTTRAEATAWAKANLPATVKHADIVGPWPKGLRKVDGKLITDPTISELRSVLDLATNLQKERMGFALANSPWSVRDMPDAPSGARAFTNDRGKWYKVSNNPQLGALNGRWVHAEALAHLDTYNSGFNWFNEAARAAAPHADDIASAAATPGAALHERGLAKIARSIGPTLRVANSSLALTKVALGAAAYRNGIFFNLATSFLTGYNVFSPRGWLSLMRGLRMALKADLDDPIYRTAIRKNLFPHPHAKERAILERQTREYTTSSAAQEARLKSLDHDIANARDAGNLELATTLEVKRQAARDELQRAGPAAMRRLIGDLASSGRKLASGEGFDAMWRFYNHFSLDSAIKLGRMHDGVRHRGLTPELAADEAAAFSQMMHTAHKGARGAAAHVPGAVFLSFRAEQIRILKNALLYRPNRVASSLALLGMWNHTNMALQGQDPTETAAALNLQAGLAHDSPLGLLRATFASVMVPGTSHRIDLGAAGLDPFPVESRLAKSVYEHVAGGAPSAIRAGAAKLAGTVLGIPFNNPIADTVFTTITGEDRMGAPAVGVKGILKAAASSVLPDWFPGVGYQWDNAIRVADGTDIDPVTGIRRDWSDFAAKIAGFRELPNSIQKFALITKTYARSLDPNRTTEIRYLEPYQDRPRNRAMRAAYRPDGTYDLKAYENELRAYQSEHPKQSIAGVTLNDDPDFIKRNLKDAGMPSSLVTFKHFSARDQIEMYARWRLIDRTPDEHSPAAELDRILTTKLSDRTLEPWQRTKVIETITALSRPEFNLPPDAVEQLNRWRDAISAREFQTFEQKFIR